MNIFVDSEFKDKQVLNIQAFNLISVIGKGAHAKVLLVKKKDDGKVYALKVLKKKFLKQNNLLDKVLQEKEILKDIDHQFIIKLVYSFQSETKFYMCLNFCQGGDLFNLLQKSKKMKENDAKFYAAQILLALEYLHDKNIIYRDLKPENVLIDRTGYIKLTDFGLSKQTTNGDECAKSLCGTAEYMAPELLNNKIYGQSVDWWTFAVLIYEMTHGTPPFINNYGKDDLRNKIINKNIPIPSTFSSQLKQLLDKLFVKDPKQRLGFKNGAKEIKECAWFKDYDWDGLLKQTIKPPYLPQLQNEYDLHEFAEEYLCQSFDSSSDISSEFSDQNYKNFNYPQSNTSSQEKFQVRSINTFQSQLSQSPELIGNELWHNCENDSFQMEIF